MRDLAKLCLSVVMGAMIALYMVVPQTDMEMGFERQYEVNSPSYICTEKDDGKD